MELFVEFYMTTNIDNELAPFVYFYVSVLFKYVSYFEFQSESVASLRISLAQFELYFAYR